MVWLMIPQEVGVGSMLNLLTDDSSTWQRSAWHLHLLELLLHVLQHISPPGTRILWVALQILVNELLLPDICLQLPLGQFHESLVG